MPNSPMIDYKKVMARAEKQSEFDNALNNLLGCHQVLVDTDYDPDISEESIEDIEKRFAELKVKVKILFQNQLYKEIL